MGKKIVIVGGVAGGASAAARLRRLDAQAEIPILEQGEHVSFSNCCLPYHLGGVVPQEEALVLMTPQRFKNQHDIDVRTGNRVRRICREKKQVEVEELATGRVYWESYDKLILSPGASPLRPASIPGSDSGHVFTLRNVADVHQIREFVSAEECRQVVVVGGGFIGMEVAENLHKAGKTVTLVEGLEQVMAPFDEDMVQILHKELMDQGLKLYLGTRVVSIEQDQVTVQRGEERFALPAQAVILAIGVRPETQLAQEAGLRIGETGGIWTDSNFRTSDEDIYAVGDAIESYDRMARKKGRLALAGPAQRQARAAASHIYGIPSPNRGFIGSSCVQVFSQNAACTGMNEKAAQKAGIPYDFAYVLPPDKPGLMPDSNYMAFKLLFEVPTGRILGAQAIGKGNVDKRVDVVAAMISMGATLEDLAELELCYSPVFGTARDVVNMAALVGKNLLEGRLRQVPVTQVRSLVEQGAYIIDVREEGEFAAGHLKGAHNIPLSQLRQRMEEIPRDVPVYLHCRTSQRSYYAYACLQGHGYSNVWNISGSFLGISLYEYFTDQDQGREPILTAYNFN